MIDAITPRFFHFPAIQSLVSTQYFPFKTMLNKGYTLLNYDLAQLKMLTSRKWEK